MSVTNTITVRLKRTLYDKIVEEKIHPRESINGVLERILGVSEDV